MGWGGGGGCCENGNALSAFRKGGIIISRLTDCQLPLLQDFIPNTLQRRLHVGYFELSFCIGLVFINYH